MRATIKHMSETLLRERSMEADNADAEQVRAERLDKLRRPFGAVGIMIDVELRDLPINSNAPDTFTGKPPTDTDDDPSGGD